MNHNANIHYNILRIVVVLVGIVLLSRVLWMQLHSKDYLRRAQANSIEEVVVYPMRGEVLDRNGEYIVKSRVCYDVMMVYRELPKEGFDTTRLLSVLDMSPEAFAKKFKQASRSPRASILVVGYLPQDSKLRLDEMDIPGLTTRFRTAREYPRKVGGNLLGYVSEVNDQQVKKWPSYAAGDYIGTNGLESAYEEELRGARVTATSILMCIVPLLAPSTMVRMIFSRSEACSLYLLLMCACRSSPRS